MLVEEITECLDRLALAIDLAGARVQVDVENGDDLATALCQYTYVPPAPPIPARNNYPIY